jgi:hypothetical protein
MPFSRSLVSVAATMGFAAGSALAQPFSFVVIPDTQFYSDNAGRFPQFLSQTNWAVNTKGLHNTRFVSHIGDIVQNGDNFGNNVEWDRANQALSILDGQLPYSAVPGNHDYEIVSLKSSGTATFNSYFGAQRYSGYPWFGGASADNQNFWQTFEGNGRTYLHIGLDWRPDSADFAWAQGVIDANPNIPTIISTHEHLTDPDSSGNGGGRTAAGLVTWNSLVKGNAQIFLVVCGHHHAGVSNHDGEFTLRSINDFGQPVYELLADYQDWTNGGSGYLRHMTFDEKHGVIKVRTYSTTLGQYQTDYNSEFTFAVDFAERFGTGPVAPTMTTLTFRQGVNGYAGAVDTEVTSATPNANQGSNSGISVDFSAGSPAGPSHALIRFGDVIDQDNPNAPIYGLNSDIITARLRLQTFDPGSGFAVHTMLTDWNASSTWTSLAAGVTANGIEALAAPEAVVGAGITSAITPVGIIEVDVTSSLRAMVRRRENFGWALIPFQGGTNGVDFVTSEGATVSQRPQLIVTVPTVPVLTASFCQGIDGYNGASDIEISAAQPDVSDPAAESITIDSDDPNGTGSDTQALLRFDGVFGSAVGQIPVGSVVTSAFLNLNVRDAGSGFTVHQMLTAFTSASTWNSLSGGVDALDVEAYLYADERAGADTSGANIASGLLMLDVTRIVQAWANGQSNHGFALRPLAAGSNGVDFWSSDSSNPFERPSLEVRYIPGIEPTCYADFNQDGGIDGTDVQAFFDVWTMGESDADVNGDGGVDGSDVGVFFAQWSAGGC